MHRWPQQDSILLCTLACVAIIGDKSNSHMWQKCVITVAMFDILSKHLLCVMLQESKKGSKYTLNLAPGTAERTTPRKAALRTPKKSQSAVPALEFHDSENTEPFSASQELVSRR